MMLQSIGLLSAPFYAAAVANALMDVASGGGSRSTKVLYEPIAGYLPQSLVTDIGAIDQDQEALEALLQGGDDASLARAIVYYKEGGSSSSVAFVNLVGGLDSDLEEGISLVGTSENGTDITGTLYADVFEGDKVLKFAYPVSTDPDNQVECQVGGRPIDRQETKGCLKPEGILTVPETGEVLTYEYNLYDDNNNGRTLQSFSLDAQRFMYDCSSDTCPRREFMKFRAYYGTSTYSDAWVTAAFRGEATRFFNGNADFSRLGLEGRSEAIKKGTVYLGVWMYVIGLMEASLDLCTPGCQDCNSEAIEKWDSAVALYTGSLEGMDGSGHGFMPYQLADKRCSDFRTCGQKRDSDVGTSAINEEIFHLFTISQLDMRNGVCDPPRSHKDRIVNLMTVPLIQSTLKYSYLSERQASVGEKEKAIGALFAASILPLVHYCDVGDADTIWENMAISTPRASFRDVKRALENNYKCLKLTCEDVGGIYDDRTRSYFPDAHPCYHRDRFALREVLGITFGVIAGVFILTCGCLPLRRRKILRKGVEMPPPPEGPPVIKPKRGRRHESAETVTMDTGFTIV